MSYEGSRETKETENNTQKAAAINVGGNLNILANRNAYVIGSDILANKDINIKGQENTIITGALENLKETENSSKTKDTIGITIGNSWLETGFQVGDAITNLAKQDYTRTEGQINAAVGAAQTAVNAAEAVITLKNIASSAETAGSLGFYASLTATHEEHNSKTENQINTNRGSTITSLTGNINLGARDGSLTKVEGSQIIANQGNITLNGKRVEIKAGENTINSKTNSEDKSITDTLLSTSASQMSLPTYSQNTNSSSSESKINQNSYIQALNGTFKINADDAEIAGAGVIAKKVDLTEITNKLTVASRQDTSNSNGKGYGFSVGNNNGINNSTTSSESKWVNNQTYLVGTEQVDINADTLRNEGAIIANISIDPTKLPQKELTRIIEEVDKDGKKVTREEKYMVQDTDQMLNYIKTTGIDNGKMNITVNNLEMVDIKDKSRTWNESLGMNVSMQNSFDTPTSIRLGDPSKGTTNISAANNGRIVEQTTGPMLGKGTIIVGGKTLTDDSPELANVSRDIKKTQVVTTSQTLGGLGVNLTVRTDALTNPVGYFQEVAAAVNGFPKNAELAGKRIGDAVGDVGNVAANTVNGRISIGEAVDLVGNVKIGKLRDQKEAENKNNEIADSVNNLLGGNAESARETLKNEVNSTTSTLGGSNTNADGSKRETYVYDEIDPNSNNQMQTPEGQIINKNEAAAITETNSKDIGFDMRNPDLQNGVEVEKLTTHEASHRAGYGEGASSLLGDVAASVWDEQNKVNNRTTNNTDTPLSNQLGFLNNPVNRATIETGNNWVSNLNLGQTDIVVGHGGAGGNAAGVTGIAKEARALAGDYPYTYVLDFEHNGTGHSKPDNAVEILKEYKHEDQEHKIMWLHSMFADAGTIEYGTNPKAKDAPEHVDELNIVLAKANLVAKNLQNMAKNADQVNIYALSKDTMPFPFTNLPGVSRYGDRSYETLQKELQNQKIPDNVNIRQLENLQGTANHAGVFAEGTIQNFQLWTQYLDSKGIKGQNQAPYMFPYVKNTEVEFKKVGNN